MKITTAKTASKKTTKTSAKTVDQAKSIAQHNAAISAEKAEQAKATKAQPKAKGTTKLDAEGTKIETVAACATRMVIEGATNEEILLVLVDVYGLSQKHAHYPGWYRAAAVRKGVVAADFAKKYAH